MSGSEQVIKNLYHWATLTRAGIEGSSRVAAANMQNYSRSNKRWKDITGNARAGLNGGMFWENMTVLKIYIAHSVFYGIYLEFIADRKYAILEESLNKFKDVWFESVKRIMGQ